MTVTFTGKWNCVILVIPFQYRFSHDEKNVAHAFSSFSYLPVFRLASSGNSAVGNSFGRLQHRPVANRCHESAALLRDVGQVEDEKEIPDPDSGIGSVAGQAEATVTRSALMPGCVTPITSSAPAPRGERDQLSPAEVGGLGVMSLKRLTAYEAT